MKTYLINEFKSLKNYLIRNWDQVFLSLALGFVLFWFVSTHYTEAKVLFSKIRVLKPTLWLSFTIEWLVLLALYKKFLSLWTYYKHSYYIKETHLSWIDRIVIVSIPPLCLLNLKHFLTSDYFLVVISSLLGFIALTYLIAVIPKIKENFQKVKLREDEFFEKTFLYSDEPIDDSTQDSIGRGLFANALKENIYNLSFKESFVMALYGKWGEGKTSILNLLRKIIREENKILVYEFDPWFYGSEDALTTNFYRGLEDLLQEYYFIPHKVKKVLRFYPEILIKGFTNIGIDFKNKESEDRPIEIKKEIEGFIAGLDKRILVIIDDIDRLQKEEVLAIFRLIKLTSHIKNLVFLISFDASRVVKILGYTDFEDPQSYIEKIIQLPINLPMTDQSKIDKFLLYSYPAIEHKSEIDKLFDRLNLNPVKRAEFDKLFTPFYQSNLRQIFSTYRVAKRYLNSILFRLPFIEREVFLYDFFIVEIIQTFYPEIYADMKSSPWYYLSSNWSFEAIAYSPLPYEPKEKQVAIRAHIEKIIEKLPNKKVVLSLLETIFPQIQDTFSSGSYHVDSGKARIDKKISHPECYGKYFMLGTREELIPDAEFEDMIKQWKDSSDIEKEIEKSFFEKYQKEFKLLQLIERLKLHSGIIDSSLVLPLISVISKNSNKLQHEGELWQNEFDQAEGLISLLVEGRKDVIKDEEISPLLKNLIQNTPRIDLATIIVLTCNETKGVRLQTNVITDELRLTLDQRLSKHFIEEKKSIFEEYSKEREFGLILYQWSTNWGKESNVIRVKVNDYLVTVFRENPVQLSFFLKHFMKEGRPFDEKKLYFDYQGFISAYDPEKFAKLITEVDSKAYTTESEKESVTAFQAKYLETKIVTPPTPTEPTLTV